MTSATPLRSVFFWEERGLVLDEPSANPYGGLLARALAPHGVLLESGWTLDPAWVRAQHGRVHVLHLNWLHRFYTNPDPVVRRERQGAGTGVESIAQRTLDAFGLRA